MGEYDVAGLFFRNAPIALDCASGAFLHPPCPPARDGNGERRCQGPREWAEAGACGRRTHTFTCTGTGSRPPPCDPDPGFLPGQVRSAEEGRRADP